MRLILLTALAMLAFAANSVLARLALAGSAPDPLVFTGLRLAAGAVTLMALVAFRTSRTATWPPAGSWPAAAALFGYALLFSFAYTGLATGTGALILFASVQFGILGWAVARGDRLGSLEALGLALAFGGLVWLVLPGLTAPDPLAATMMVGAGLCWAVYTLLGRGSKAPLADTAGNFLRGLPLALLLVAIGIWQSGLAPTAALYAVASGALASGLGYALWYAVLPALSRTQAGIVQLTVPVIAAFGGLLLLAEPLTLRLVGASLAILGGVALALLAGNQRRARSS